MKAGETLGSDLATLNMRTLLLCSDVPFLGVTHGVLDDFGIAPQVMADEDAALQLLEAQNFEVAIVDWSQIESLPDFLVRVRQSRNADCVFVAIVRDQLDMRQAFAAGVQLLIHKPASAEQIARCLRAAYSATVRRRRKQHREPVDLAVAVSTHSQPFMEASMVNLSERGARLALISGDRFIPVFAVGEDIEIRFSLPDTAELLDLRARVVWKAGDDCGVQFDGMAEHQQTALQHWLTDRVVQSLAARIQGDTEACA